MSERETWPKPLDAIMLNVGDGHWLYVEECGTRTGVPAIFLHGGPGSGAQIAHRSLFDPNRYHAILFDQRGSGRSHPYLERRANTTRHLVADIEAIRRHYGIDKWIVVGGSWGSTLALAYAEQHPSRVAGLVLRAIFLGTTAEVQWAFIDGPKRFRPDLYQNFLAMLPEAERAEPLGAYLHRLTSTDPRLYEPAARVWHAYERTLSELDPGQVTLADATGPGRMPPTPLMEAHYIANEFFLAPRALIDNADRLKGIPGVIVQGRYDLLCPPAAAYAVARAWGSAELKFVEKAGHAMTEPGIMAALRDAIGRIADKVTVARR
ncbi:MAG: prolyl aminopeptidase [Hyphomicrobium sp.]|nr:prolyl aminopeptidase [Hyphomicrobium sp.]